MFFEYIKFKGLNMKKSNGIYKFLTWVEVIGNKLPHPATIFVILSIIVIFISEIVYRMGVTVQYLGFKDGEETMITVRAISLLNVEGIIKIFTTAVGNFTGFAPLGTVLVAMLGIGVADSSGLIGVSLKSLVIKTPKKLVTAVIVFAGCMSNIASDAGYVILIPLGAMIFLTVGRHPLAGLAAAFAGVSGGFSANLLVGTIDPLLSGLSTSAAHIINPHYNVAVTSNYYFMAVSVFIITLVGSFVTEKIVEPRLGEYKGLKHDNNISLSDTEKKGLIWAGISLLIFIIIMAILVVPYDGILRGKHGAFLRSPFMDSIVLIMALFFFIPGVVYAVATKEAKNDKDIVHAMGKSMSSMGLYLVLAFFAAQFIYYFSYTNIGTIISVTGANFLKSTGFTGIPLMLCFVLLTAFLNLFLGSASAKWAIMAPIFVPMFMQIGYSPEFVQLAYRIGDSSTNIITPLMSYFAMIVAFAGKYDVADSEPTGLGTITSLMLPYSISFLIVWSILLVIWYMTGFPIGIGGFINYIP